MSILPTAAAAAALLASTWALAQATPDTTPPAAPTLSDDEIRKAIEADTKSNAASSPPAAVSPAASTGAPPSAAGAPGPALRFFQSLNPDMSFITDVAGSIFSTPMEMVGDHDPKENGFNLQALELAVGASVDPYFRFDANLVFKQEGGVEIEEAYGTTRELPYGLQVRAGKFLTRFGRFNATHPHTWTFSDAPLVSGRFFGPDGNRGVGMEVSDLLNFLPWYVEVVLAANDTRGEGNSFLPAGGPGGAQIKSFGDIQYTGTLSQFFPLSDDLSLSWGLSGATGANGNGPSMRTEIYGTDVYLKYRPLTEGSITIVSLQGEFLARRYETPASVAWDTGAFAHLFWRFSQRWGAALSAEYVNAATQDNFNIAGVQQRYKADVTFWPTEFSRLRLQYDVEPPGADHDGVAHAVFLAVEFAVGAHGAHKF